ncbi:MAG: AAA family ATPase [Rhodospirillales bacterium]|nr:AAA family ATPase [Rhodospirillales bacterium]
MTFSDVSIDSNSISDLYYYVIMKPERLFSGIYRQLVTDYVHDRLIPSKPDRLLYLKVVSEIFSQLNPNVAIKNFSGKHKTGEFVLLGANVQGRRKPLFDVREFSSGEKALLSTIGFLCIARSVSALIIDEPENHFHEGLLLQLVEVLSALCDQGGLLGWIEKAYEKNQFQDVKRDWLQKEYQNHKLNQVILSTHSKSLIYKTFSLGRNYVVEGGVRSLVSEGAEKELRKIGLSAVNNQVLLVEGSGDIEALEYFFKGRNVAIKDLGGAEGVIDTFKRVSRVKGDFKEATFVFVVDSDNKLDEFFEKIRKVDPDYYDSVFLKMKRHEIENYLIDPNVISEVLKRLAEGLGVSDVEGVEVGDVEEKALFFAKESMPIVYRKEITSTFRYKINDYFSEKIWSKRSKLDWSNIEVVKNLLSEDAFFLANVEELFQELQMLAEDIIKENESVSSGRLLEICDGKIVFNQLTAAYGKLLGVNAEHIKRLIYKRAFADSDSALYSLAKDISEKFDS